MIKNCLRLSVLLIFIFILQDAYSFNRFFDVSPGFRIIGMAINMSSRMPGNSTTTTFDFGAGLNFDFQLEKVIGLDIELLYLRKGSDGSYPGSRIVLHYFSVPTLVEIWVERNKFAFVIGPVHNFLMGANGKLRSPNVELNSSNTRLYDL